MIKRKEIGKIIKDFFIIIDLNFQGPSGANGLSGAAGERGLKV